MPTISKIRFAVIALALLGCALGTWAAEPPETLPRSPRNANYTIDVQLDTERRMLHGRQTLVWRNIQDRPTDELWFHLYWNAWRNDRSTWMLQSSLGSRRRRDVDKLRPEDWGYLEVDSIRLPQGDGAEARELITTAFFAAPDDGNSHDRTVLVVPLTETVAPGEEVEVQMTWRAKIPRTFARTGFRGDFYFIAHWFPKLGVFEGDGWNCHQYHATTEYFSDYGSYRVSMTVPEDWVLGATGREIEQRVNGDGTTTHVYGEDDVHAFTWTVSPDYIVREGVFDEPGLPPVDLRLLIQPEHLGQADRHMDATRAALKHYGTWYGPYPYGHLTFIDPAYGSRAGGMEYPTIFTCGTRLFAPFGGDRPESVTVHEAGHQFWYALVGNNEFEYAWLDEGLNTFSTIRTLDETYPPRKLVRYFLPRPGDRGLGDGFFPVMFDSIESVRILGLVGDYRDAVTSDNPSTPTFRYVPRTASDISYDKTALWLATLERHLGWDTLQSILSTFFERYRFAHPRPEDFFATAEEVSGRDLDWFFRQVYYDSVVFDFAIDHVSSVPAGPTGLVDQAGELVPAEKPEDEEGTVYRTDVLVHRHGGGIFPVEIRLVFEDGHEVSEVWSGSEKSKRVVVEHPAKLQYAAVDPERVLLLDIDYTNNSRLLEPRATLPARKWASKWMIWFQDMLSSIAFFM
jgi:hypothetical protein